ncbi:MAG: N-acetyl-gamma-glutamyl-phosphate reductase [Syntrophomonadaceae bacterium]|nr:N-acetyl-gamma-glutamyl-phosphate reductase [Syntrophomonadaceae bacterium]MDD3023408.1 N-acetyl-gamma-glutamyl-phosphate reductase [Syntrophomonadaceae bacterium]
MYKVGIVGDGYTAADLLRLLAGHDEAEAVCIFSTENIGRRIDEVYPHLMGFSDLKCQAGDWNLIKNECDAVFLALPHGLSVPIAMELLPAGVRCVDLGADFRLKDALLYESYYEITHEAPHMLQEAVFGLPEIYREKISKSRLVANPGCFPTGAILPLAPLLEAGMVESQGIIVDSKTGVSGAGKTPKASSHFCGVNEGIRAYGVGNHRHGPEIAQELSFAAGEKVKMTFTPHLVPMNRGILTTIYARLRSGADALQVRKVLENKYRDEYFVRVLPQGVMPYTKWVNGSNFIDIGIHCDEESGMVILVSALDNLVKGASGQAIQNLNIMLGMEENKGLKIAGMYP